mmetsp:Transcript_38321/g.105554  ORF Transcript_38321/g.105554 Transcript_38321/m.105554 type:complete len:227 (-) Transcript_38321:265-945(-)
MRPDDRLIGDVTQVPAHPRNVLWHMRWQVRASNALKYRPVSRPDDHREAHTSVSGALRRWDTMHKVLIERLIEREDVAIFLSHPNHLSSRPVPKGEVPRFSEAQPQCHSGPRPAVVIVVVVHGFRVPGALVHVHPAVYQFHSEGFQQARHESPECDGVFQSIPIHYRVPAAGVLCERVATAGNVRKESLHKAEVVMGTGIRGHVQTATVISKALLDGRNSREPRPL